MPNAILERRARAIRVKKKGTSKWWESGRLPGDEYAKMRNIQPRKESRGRKKGCLNYSCAIPVHVRS